MPCLLSFQTKQVDDPTDELVRDPLGKTRQDPVTQAVDLLEQVRLGLLKKHKFVAGIAFTHVPQAETTSGQRAGPDPGPPAKDSAWGGAAAEQKLFRDVMERLLQTDLVRKNYPPEFAWPPKIYIEPSSRANYNAFAGPYGKDDGSGKYLVRAFITEGYMAKIVKGDGEKLAAIMGHELAHITKGHLFNRLVRDVPGLAFSRQQEIEADLEGVRIAAAAGFSARSGIKAAMDEWKLLGDFSNFEGIKVTHPSWADRLALLDKKREPMWQAMAAYQNGYFFLHAEQYPAAEDCFLHVTKQFPDCSEAWANLGYARLMRYCDSLDAVGLRRYGLAQFVAGGFYARPQDTELTRGDPILWRAAVAALETALKKNDKLVLARANLGLAYLIAPTGKQTDKALAQFDAAAKLAAGRQGPESSEPRRLADQLWRGRNGAGPAQCGRGQVQVGQGSLAAARLGHPSSAGPGPALQRSHPQPGRAGQGGFGPELSVLWKVSGLEETSPDAAIWWTLAHDRLRQAGQGPRDRAARQGKTQKPIHRQAHAPRRVGRCWRRGQAHQAERSDAGRAGTLWAETTAAASPLSRKTRGEVQHARKSPPASICSRIARCWPSS